MKRFLILMSITGLLTSGTAPLFPAKTAPCAGIENQEASESAAEESSSANDISETDVVNDETAVPQVNPVVAQRQSLEKARMLLTDAVRSCEQGSLPRAKELYGSAFAELSSAGIDASTLYRAREEFSALITKLNDLLKDDNRAKTQSDGQFIIAMDKDNAKVKKYLQIYSEGRAREEIRKALERSGKYRAMILAVLKEYDLPEELVYLPIVESLYKINDLSSAGAYGLWQIMPLRARALNLKVNYWIDERKDPEKSTRAAAQYLRELYLMFDNWHLALAAYNRGEYGLARDLKFSNATNIQEISDRNAVPRETGNYVPQFIASALIGKDPARYGFTDLKYEQPVAVDTITIANVIDLKIVAQCAGTTVDVIRELNPSLKAWCTPHNYPEFVLKLPAGSRDAFLTSIAQVKDLNPSRGFIKYKVVRGDCLSKIASKFATTVADIREDNRIKNAKSLKIGQVLVIKPGRKYFAKMKN